MSDTETGIDYNRVGLLLHIVNEAGPAKYPSFSAIYQAAMRELTMINDDLDPKKANPQIVTPPDGPANSAVANPDGSYTRLQPEPVGGAPILGPGEQLAQAADQAKAKEVQAATNREIVDRARADAPSPNPRPNEATPPVLPPGTQEKIDADAKARADQVQRTGSYEKSVIDAGKDDDTPRRA